MFPAARFEVRLRAVCDEDPARASSDATDFCDLYAGNFSGHASPAARREQEFIVFSAMQREVDVDFLGGFADARLRNGFLPDFAAYPTFLA